MDPRIYLILLFCLFAGATGNSDAEEKPTRFQIVTLHYDEVKEPLIIVIWIVMAASMKILFNHASFLSKYIPESALLILVGLAMGGVLKALHAAFTVYTLESKTFFLFLLPPIIFDAGYFMPNRALFENSGSVLLFSIVGTLFNTFMIGWLFLP
ncbi:unnamed protein product, partial [Mesorhabditis spiculigera]